MGRFLPEDYKVPSTSNYMKFKADDNRFRVLSKPVMGWEYWVDTEDGKRSPRRVKAFEELPAGVVNATNREKQAKHFWAFVVWNYAESKIQILELTQKSIMKAIETLSSDDDWGAPFDYDIVVKKEGDGLETEYQTNPKPKKEVDDEIAKAYKSVNIELEALYKGDDPFSANEKVDEENVKKAGLIGKEEEVGDELPF
jgi:hypothetical protein